MSRVRTFIAVEAPAEVRQAGEKLIRKFSKVVENARWVKTENIHVTMKFLGDVEDRELHAVCQAAAAAAASVDPFTIASRGIGAFPNVARPNTLWMGVNDEAQQLQRLHAAVENAMGELRFPFESRRYQGHLTLGRLRSDPDVIDQLQKLVDNHAGSEFGVIPVDELIIYSSELDREGPTHNVIGRCSLGSSPEAE